jgi:hypothetical protein
MDGDVKMKKWILGFVVLTLLCPLAYAAEKKQTKAEVEAKEAAEEAEYNKWHETVFSTDDAWENGLAQKRKYECEPICEEPLKVKIAGQSFLMPRQGTTFYTEDGKVYLNMTRRCDMGTLNNVKTVEDDLFYMTSVENGNKTEFEKDKEDIDQFRAKKKSVILANGIEKLGEKNLNIYIFPQSIIPTFSDHPATFYCLKYKIDDPEEADEFGYRLGEYERCSTSYYIRPHLIIRYSIDSLSPQYSNEIFLPKRDGNSTEGWIKEYVDVINEKFNSYAVKEVKVEKGKWQVFKAELFSWLSSLQ